MTFRPSLLLIATYVFCSAFAASGLAFLPFGLRQPEGGPLPGSFWITLLVLFGIFLGPLPFIRCELSHSRVYVRNYFRSYSFPWSEVVAFEVSNSPFLSLVDAWADVPRFTLHTGQVVYAYVLTTWRGSRKGRRQAFLAFVEERHREFGFRLSPHPVEVAR